MLIRVADPARPAFQLRKGEEGISIFDTDAVAPPLTEKEILDCFRPGCVAVALAWDDIQNKGLGIVPIPGASSLPERLQVAHAEIRAGSRMSRAEFKKRLKDFE